MWFEKKKTNIFHVLWNMIILSAFIKPVQKKKKNRLSLLVSCFIFPWHLNINAAYHMYQAPKKQNVCAHLFPGYPDRCWRFSLDPLPQSTVLKSIHFFDKPIFPVITFCLVFFPPDVSQEWRRAKSYLVFDKSKL